MIQKLPVIVLAWYKLEDFTCKKRVLERLFKTMSKRVFGKNMVSIRNHEDIMLVTSLDKYGKYVMKQNFKDGYLVLKELFAAEIGKTEIKIKKPVYLRQAILDLCKGLIYKLHYDYMQQRYGSKLKLCYMDTLSFEYETEDFYKDFAKVVETRFDTSGYLRGDNMSLLILPLAKTRKL